MGILKAGTIYFVLVFGTGFVLGTVRTLWVVPRLGVRTAELLETPFMLVAIVLAVGWISRRIGNADGSSIRVAVGVFALALLLAAEVSMGVVHQGLSFVEVFTKHDPVSGTVYYALLGVFAWMRHGYSGSMLHMMPANHAPQRTRPSLSGCNLRGSWAMLLRFGR